MNFIPKLKIIPLTAVITLGLALSPAISLAADKDHGGQKNQYQYDAGKSRSKQPRKEQHVIRADKRVKDGRGYKPVIINHHAKPYIVRSKPVHYINYPYRHEHHGTREYIVVDHDHHDHYLDYEYIDYDDVRFKIGIHTGNFDIVFRD